MPRQQLNPTETAHTLQDRFANWGLANPDLGSRNLHSLAQHLTTDFYDALLALLDRSLPGKADPDMALNNLERLLANANGRTIFYDWLARDERNFEILIVVLSTSQFFSDLIAANPDFLDVVASSMSPSPTRQELISELEQNLNQAADDAQIMRTFRRYRQWQQVKIGVNDIVRQRPLEEITLALSLLADAVIEVALRIALKNLEVRFGQPRTSSGEPSSCVVLAFGKLGGEELNYSSDIDLMIIYDEEGTCTGKRSVLNNDEFYTRLVAELVRLLSAHTDRGQAYRVDLRLRPEGNRGPTARSLASTLSYYDTLGRTWERQALIKVRPVAGNRELGDEFLRSIEGFIWRKYLSFAEINEIKSMKRRIENHSRRSGERDTDVKTGVGGIRDIEFTIQFLQLLNGGDLPVVRQRGTLNAIHALEEVGCLTDPEYRALDDTYRFLRKTEHRLQILFDWQTHRLPASSEEIRKLAMRMGYTSKDNSDINSRGMEARTPAAVESAQVAGPVRSSQSPQRHSPIDEPSRIPRLQTRDLLIDPLDQFLHDYWEKTRLNRTILDHLLHQTFAGSETEAEPESDLILAPDPDDSTIQQALSRYHFLDYQGAYRNLARLAQEAGPFLSTRRCRHFLASIAPQLLRAISQTPDPDSTLNNLERVTASLGAKAVLWELFSFLPASLKLYVDICSNSTFLSEILINNPGMIDDLLDSLILNQPRTCAELSEELKVLCRGVEKPEAIDAILRSFQDKELLRIGVRDLLGQDQIRATTAALSDLAEAILLEVSNRQCEELASRLKIPLQLANFLGTGG